jgi:hypothetical protein
MFIPQRKFGNQFRCLFPTEQRQRRDFFHPRRKEVLQQRTRCGTMAS